MSPDTKTVFNVEQVCAIISKCAESGVTELKFGDLHVSFQPKSEQTTQAATWARPAHHSDTEISEELLRQTDKERLEQDERRFREEQLAEMMLTDPLAYEELLASGELEDRDEA